MSDILDFEKIRQEISEISVGTQHKLVRDSWLKTKNILDNISSNLLPTEGDGQIIVVEKHKFIGHHIKEKDDCEKRVNSLLKLFKESKIISIPPNAWQYDKDGLIYSSVKEFFINQKLIISIDDIKSFKLQHSKLSQLCDFIEKDGIERFPDAYHTEKFISATKQDKTFIFPDQKTTDDLGFDAVLTKKPLFQESDIELSRIRGQLEVLNRRSDLQHKRKDISGAATEDPISPNINKIRSIYVVNGNQRNNNRLVINKNYIDSFEIRPSTSINIQSLANAILDKTDTLKNITDLEACKTYLNSNSNCRIYKNRTGKKKIYTITPIVGYKDRHSSNKVLEILPGLTTDVISFTKYNRLLSEQNNRNKN